MVFKQPAWVPRIPVQYPDSIPISEFIFNESYGRVPLHESRPFFTCAVSGQTVSAHEARDRTEYLARALAKELGWSPNHGNEWDKVIAVFSANTVRWT